MTADQRLGCVFSEPGCSGGTGRRHVLFGLLYIIAGFKVHTSGFDMFRTAIVLYRAEVNC